MLQHLIKRYTSTETVSQWRNKYSFKKVPPAQQVTLVSPNHVGNNPAQENVRKEYPQLTLITWLLFVALWLAVPLLGVIPCGGRVSFIRILCFGMKKKQYTKFNWKWQLYYWKSLWQIQNKTRKKKTKTLETEPGITLNTEGRNTA